MSNQAAGSELAVEMMRPDFLLWRCLHGGPLSRESLERPEPNPQVDWPAARARNIPLLDRLTEVYGACAVVAREGDRIVGIVRFYPKAVRAMAGSIGFCLQQAFPCGPPADLARTSFPPLDRLDDRTLSVHCMTAGRPGAREDPHRRRGLGTAMVEALVGWAGPRGWRAVEATACQDLDGLYAISGMAGRPFWEKLGFRAAATVIEPALREENEVVANLRREAAERGIDADRLAETYTMRLDLA